jgi:putative zinc finger/helix-turn-helix YgiT family protein
MNREGNKMKGICPICEDIRDIKVISKTEISKVKGREVESVVEYSICLQCNEEFATSEQMNTTLTNAYNQYRIIEGIISPSDIINIREKYGVSQKAFAKILDLGELTINSFEQGSLPSKSVSNLIKFMDKKDNFIDLFQRNKHKLTKLQITKIERKLSEQFEPIYQEIEDSGVDIAEPFSGYNHTSWDKYINVLQLILHFANERLYKMALLKIAFYVDFVGFRDTVRSISGWPYAAINYGPVPNDWKKLLFQAENEGMLTSEPDDCEMGDQFFLPEGLNIEEVKKGFTDTEIKIIQHISTVLKDKSATELRNLTHLEDAWKETEHAKLIDYSWAKSLKLFNNQN